MIKLFNQTLFFYLAAIFFIFFLCGCGVFRGMPSHGGGKRFDEEQRIVAGAIRHALADMDLKELVGKRVQIIVNSLAHDGGATANWPGFQDIYISGSPFDEYEYENFRQFFREYGPKGDEDKWVPNYKDKNSYSPATNMSVRYRPYMTYSPHRVSSNPDIIYFKAALDMKARHSGITLTANNPEITLYVLIDVLGTNLSRLDTIVIGKDQLKASCELTYYAQENETGKLLFHERRTSAAAQYKESSVLYIRLGGAYQLIENTAPTPFPTYGTKSPGAGGNHLNHDFTSPSLSTTKDQQKLVNEYLNTLIKNAELQLEMNNIDFARQDIEKIISIDPDYPGLSELIQKLEESSRSITR